MDNEMQKIINKMNLSDAISRIKEEAGIEDTTGKKKTRKIVDIVTFCEDKNYLSFLDQKPPFILTKTQKIILKCFYSGGEGNEDLKLDEIEIEWLQKWKEGKNKEKQLLIDNILKKNAEQNFITELILVLGRRSGKTALASIIAAYEAYKCLEHYNPQEYFGIAPDNQIVILNVATAGPQAKLLYNEIRSRLRHSGYFKNRLNQEACNEEYTYLFTDNDLDTNERLRKEGRFKEQIKGSVVIQCGHSNSNSLMGTGIICLIFDELAYFNDGAGSTGGFKIYGDLVPATKAFKYKDGRPAAKIVSISAPAGKSGIFYSNFRMSLSSDGDNMMSFQFPTWECSPVITSKDQLKSEFDKNEAEAECRYGAEFSGAMSSNFFPSDSVELCIDHNLFNREKGLSYIRYYMHVDPALNSHNYCIAIVHQESYRDKETREIRRKIIVDHIKMWQSVAGREIDINTVENYILAICKKFNIVSITYDEWNSASSIQKFRKKGLPVKRTAFRNSYSQLIYSELRDLVIAGNLRLILDEYLIGEFKSVLYKMTQKGFKIHPDKDSEFPTDDYCDCVAGASHSALENNLYELPQITTFRNPIGMGGRLKSIFATKQQTKYGGN